MSNFLYPAIKTKMLTGQFDWTGDSVCVVLVATGLYVPSIYHATLLDIPAAARVAMSDVLTGRTVVGTTVDADDYRFAYVSGPPVNAAVLLVNTGVEATSLLIGYLDTAVVGLPFNPAAGPIELVWDNGPNKIFTL